MNCMDIARAMVKNRVLNINYSIDNGCDGYITTHIIKLYYEIYDFAKYFYEQKEQKEISISQKTIE